MYSPETVVRIDQLRALALTRQLTIEEQQEAIRLIRADRVGASYASAGVPRWPLKVLHLWPVKLLHPGPPQIDVLTSVHQ